MKKVLFVFSLFLALAAAEARTDLRIPTGAFQENAVLTTGNNYASRAKFSGSKIINGNIMMVTGLGTINSGNGITAKEFGGAGYNRLQIIFSNTTIGTLDTVSGSGHNGSLSIPLYTFPTTNGGHFVFDVSEVNLALSSSNGNVFADTPSLGVGTVAVTGGRALVSDTTNAASLFSTLAMTDFNGTVSYVTRAPSNFIMDQNSERIAYLNVREKFSANDNGSVIKANGTLTLFYKNTKY